MKLPLPATRVFFRLRFVGSPVAYALGGVGLAATLTTLTPSARAQATYDTTNGANFNWSDTTGWTPTPPTGGPGTGDTANLDNVAANRIVTYDTAATGLLGALAINETGGFNNELLLTKGLNISTATTLGATGAGSTATLDTQDQTLTNSLLSINSGGQLLLGKTGQTTNTTFLSGALALHNGGVITTNSAVGSGTTTLIQTLGGTGTFTMDGGTLNITQSAASGGTRLTVANNVSITGGAVNFSGTATANIAALYMNGATNTISSGATLTGTGTTVQLGLSAATNQSLTYGAGAVFDLNTRVTTAGMTSVKTLSVTGGNVGSLFLSATGSAASVDTLRLGTDLTVASGKALFGTNFSAVGTLNPDFNGHTYDGTAVTTAWAPANTVSGTDTWSLTSTTGTGTFKAQAFNFNAGAAKNLRMTVGANVTLQATGTIANDFRVTTPTTGASTTSFDPASTFLYTGTAATINTVGSTTTTTLGKLTIGDGTNPSTLTASSAIATAGAVTINNAGALALGANALTTPVAVTLNGGGSLGANVLTQALLGQISGTSGSATAPAFLNLTANQTLSGTNALDFSAAGLANVSLGGNSTLTATAGQITPANNTYKIGSPLGTFTIPGAALSGATNNLEVDGSVILGTNAATYGGTTLINNGGRVRLAADNRLPATTALTINAGGALDLGNTDAGTTATVGSLAGAGLVTNSSGSTVAPNKILAVNPGTGVSTTFSGTIEDRSTGAVAGATNALLKTGAGTLTLAGASTYTGGTTVSGGFLRANNAIGSATGTGLVTVSGTSATAFGTLGGGAGSANGGTLGALAGGATLRTYAPGLLGVISGATTVNAFGHLAPGNSVGTLTVASLTLATGAVADYEFNGAANDFTSVTGALTINGGVASVGVNLFQEGGSTAFTTAGTYNLFGYGAGSAITTSDLFVANQQSGFNYNFINDATDGLVQLSITAVPEPGTLALGLLGVGAMGCARRRLLRGRA